MSELAGKRRSRLTWLDNNRREFVDILALLLIFGGLLTAILMLTLSEQSVSDAIDAGGLFVAAGAALLTLNQ